ncbi:MAG: hypothetical protein RDU14_13510 [Melioribacteraceae bacterium]|nr:hypothetical protein [Melioribacteraceae bacterium]
MRTRKYLIFIVTSLLTVLPSNIIAQNENKLLISENIYLDAAMELGDYLLKVQDKNTKSWSMVWNEEATDAIVSFYAIGSLNRLSKVANNSKYFDAAIESITWWLENMFLGDKDKCKEWIWNFDNKIAPIKGWNEGEWKKCEGAFLSQYYPQKDGYSNVRVGSIHMRDGATLGVELVKKLPNAEMIIKSMKKWYISDLDNKAPFSGNSNHRGFLTMQSFTDRNNDGFLEILEEYSLWGSRHQSALVNAQMIPDLIELGLISQAEERAEWLLEIMQNKINGNLYEMFDMDKGIQSVGYKSNFTFANGQVAEGLLVAYEHTNKKKYLDAALLALDWLIKTQAHIDNNVVYFTEDKVYRTFSAVPALCKAYMITGRIDYLIYAKSAGDWIISQMKTPFDGFEDKNAWTVAEGLEAIVSLCEILNN